jgi:hypothetical protein
MKIRQGFPQDLGLYIQQGDQPGADDQFLGIIFDPARAEILVQILNGEQPPFDRE